MSGNERKEDSSVGRYKEIREPLINKTSIELDEKNTLRKRVELLNDKYDWIEVEKIIFVELDEIGLESEYYLDIMDELKEEFVDKA